MPLDRTFKALADPTRRHILRTLRGGSLPAGELAERLGVAPNALSFHLRILEAADLIDARRDGRFIVYTLNSSVVDEVIQFFLDQFTPRRNGRSTKARTPAARRTPSENES